MSFLWSAIPSEATRNAWTTVAKPPVKHFDMQIAINGHLSQSTGIGAFDGQQGISCANSSVMADGDD